MFIEKIKTPGLSHLSYLVGADGQAAVIAPRRDCHIYVEMARAEGLALTHIINAHHKLSISQVWGTGTTSSSDGQFFRGAKRGASGGDINASYGNDPGFSFYTHVSDQHGLYHVKVISAATH